jgi:hypothetical protein
MKKISLEECIYSALSNPVLDREVVINACDSLSKRIEEGKYDSLIEMSGISHFINEADIEEVVRMLSREYLCQKVEMELGLDSDKVLPLGVLFHIGAGNMEGLTAFSVVEGLLAGNINLVKLSSKESGISALLLKELLTIEPRLKDYVYLYSFPSSEKEKIIELVNLSDAVVVWGGDSTIRSVRSLVPANCRLIEWGHKISFAYVVPGQFKEKDCYMLAEHLIKTKQLLCSSAQGIYVDTDQEEEVHKLCQRFIKILDEAGEKHGDRDPIGIAQNTLKAYTYRLEHRSEPYTEYQGAGTRIFYKPDRELESSMSYGNIWVKALPRTDIIKTLKKHHGHLQTVGLLCSEEEMDMLSALFFKAGATRVRRNGDMSTLSVVEAHDGEYPLRRYSKICCKA